MLDLVCHIQGGAGAEGVREQDAASQREEVTTEVRRLLTGCR